MKLESVHVYHTLLSSHFCLIFIVRNAHINILHRKTALVKISIGRSCCKYYSGFFWQIVKVVKVSNIDIKKYMYFVPSQIGNFRSLMRLSWIIHKTSCIINKACTEEYLRDRYQMIATLQHYSYSPYMIVSSEAELGNLFRWHDYKQCFMNAAKAKVRLMIGMLLKTSSLY